jgi:hypothetical protein
MPLTATTVSKWTMTASLGMQMLVLDGMWPESDSAFFQASSPLTD